jgi:hypothetical protein
MRPGETNVEIKMNRTMREELIEAGQYLCFRAKYAKRRTWYFRALAWVCRLLNK